jgi:hypothetical protein
LAGGIWLEFICRSWMATSMRNFAAVAINPPSRGKIARPIPPPHGRSCSRKCLRKNEIEKRARRLESGISIRRCQLSCNCQLNSTAPHPAESVGISQAVTATRSAEFVAGLSR